MQSTSEKQKKEKERRKAALLVIDMTNDFLLKSYNPQLALERGQELIPRIRKLEEAFLSNGLPVIYTTDRHLKSDFELKKWGPHSMKGTKGSKIVEGLITEGIKVFERNWKPSDLRSIEKLKALPKGKTGKPPYSSSARLLFEVEKGTYSGFTDNGGKPTALDFLLKKLGFGPGDRLFITGLHTNCCDKHTAADAWFRGYVPVIVNDCVDAFDDPDGKIGMGHDRALNYESYWYNAEIMPSEQVIEKISKR